MGLLLAAKCVAVGVTLSLIVVGLTLWLTGLTEDDDVLLSEVWA
jgi:hypothetical protein